MYIPNSMNLNQPQQNDQNQKLSTLNPYIISDEEDKLDSEHLSQKDDNDNLCNVIAELSNEFESSDSESNISLTQSKTVIDSEDYISSETHQTVVTDREHIKMRIEGESEKLKI